MVPPYRADQCNHICLLWGGPNWVYCHASRRRLQRGKVMRGRYLGRVGRHKPCVPVFGFELMSPFGTVLFCHDGGRWMSRVDIGATQD